MSTLVDESILDKENIESLIEFRSRSENINILYLGNISRTKGVWEVIEAYRILCNKLKPKNLKCSMAGDGKELEALKKYVNTHNLNIDFPGYVKDKKKADVFKNSHIYVFPSFHGEGMPTSVLEAMAFGLPVITTRVGGLPDFF